MTSRPESPLRYPRVGTLWSGAGSVEQLGSALAELGLRRCLAVVSPSAVAGADAVSCLEQWSDGRVAAVFSDLAPHTPYDRVLAAAHRMRELGADGVVSLGGGNAIDTARLASLCVGRGVESPEGPDGLHALRIGAGADGPRLHQTDDPALAAVLPHVAVPTTLSAAEFSDGGAATSPARRKELFVGSALALDAVITDPVLSGSVPADMWVMTGVRALDHAVETILSTRGGRVTDELSTRAIVHLRAALPAVLADPDDLAAREQAQLGAWLSYFGVGSGVLGLSHAIGHQLGATFGIPHALASCISLPDTMRFLAPRVPERMRLVAEAWGVGTTGSDDVVAARTVDAVDGFVRSLGFPRRLGEAGVALTDVGAVAQAVLADVLVDGTPGGPPGVTELEALLGRLA